MKILKTLFYYTLVVLIAFFPLSYIHAANSHSIDLEAGSSQYLNIADNASLSITGDMTVEAWIKTESTAEFALTKWTTSGNQRSWEFKVSSAGTFGVILSSAGSGLTQDAGSQAFSDGDWHHWTFAYDASAGEIEVYFDANSIDTMVSMDTSIFDGTADLDIGRDGGKTVFADGLIDEVRIWDDIRTASEISTNYQLELVGDEANLQAYWKFNDDLLDETTNDNDLTNNNSAVFSTNVPFVGEAGGVTPGAPKMMMGMSF